MMLELLFLIFGCLVMLGAIIFLGLGIYLLIRDILGK